MRGLGTAHGACCLVLPAERLGEGAGVGRRVPKGQLSSWLVPPVAGNPMSAWVFQVMTPPCPPTSDMVTFSPLFISEEGIIMLKLELFTVEKNWELKWC